MGSWIIKDHDTFPSTTFVNRITVLVPYCTRITVRYKLTNNKTSVVLMIFCCFAIRIVVSRTVPFFQWLPIVGSGGHIKKTSRSSPSELRTVGSFEKIISNKKCLRQLYSVPRPETCRFLT